MFLIRESSHFTHEVVIIIPSHHGVPLRANYLKIAMITFSLNLECTIFQVNPKRIRTQKESLMQFALRLVNIADSLKGNKRFNMEKLKYCKSQPIWVKLMLVETLSGKAKRIAQQSVSHERRTSIFCFSYHSKLIDPSLYLSCRII